MSLVWLGLVASLIVYTAGFLPAKPFEGVLNLVSLAQVGVLGGANAPITIKLPTANNDYLLGYPLKVQWVKNNVPNTSSGKVVLKDAAGVIIYDSSTSAQAVNSTNNSYIFTIPTSANVGPASLTVSFTDTISGKVVAGSQKINLIDRPSVSLQANFDDISQATKLSWNTTNVPKHWLGRVSVYGPGIFNRVVKDKLAITRQAGEFNYPLDYMAAGTYQFTLEFYDPTKTQTGTVKITGTVYKPE
jgi:hypothetical protein